MAVEGLRVGRSLGHADMWRQPPTCGDMVAEKGLDMILGRPHDADPSKGRRSPGHRGVTRDPPRSWRCSPPIAVIEGPVGSPLKSRAEFEPSSARRGKFGAAAFAGRAIRGSHGNHAAMVFTVTLVRTGARHNQLDGPE